MVTRWKAAARRTGVKITCFVLVLVFAFAGLTAIFDFTARGGRTDVHHSVIFFDIEKSGYFYSRTMPQLCAAAETVLLLKGPEYINSGELLWWEFDYDRYMLIDAAGCVYESVYTDEGTVWAKKNGAQIEEPEEPKKTKFEDYVTEEDRQRYESNAIRNQLYRYETAQKVLAQTPGLMWSIVRSDGGSFSNVSARESNETFFLSQREYIVLRAGEYEKTSRGVSYFTEISGMSQKLSHGDAIYLAFDEDHVNAMNEYYRTIQRSYIADAAVLLLSCLLGLVCLIVLWCGAGRREGGDDTVYFTAIDRVPSDIGFVLLFVWLVIVRAIAVSITEIAWQYRDMRGVIVAIAGGVKIAGIPALLWLGTVVKRMKARELLRSTFAGKTILGTLSGLNSMRLDVLVIVKSCSAGAAVFLMIAVSGVAGSWDGGTTVFLLSVLGAFGAGFVVLRYLVKVKALAESVREVSLGGYDKKIECGAGELGRIAECVNNISQGINTAVAERTKSERLKTELITNVSHDIRTPLTSIISYAGLLKQEGLEGKAADYLEVLIKKSARLKTMTDELFEAAKAATGNIEVSLSRLDLSSLVTQVLGELDEPIKQSGLDFRVSLPENAYVNADGKLMWRVLDNLLTNALKYALAGSRVYVNVTDEHGEYRLEIKNISAAALNISPEELTERFVRGDESRTDEGSGLGLSIARSFVEAQGGRFILEIDGDLFKTSVLLCYP